MSIHSSLRGVDNLKGERSVLSRLERIQKLRKDGKFDTEAGSVHGLPKVRTKFKGLGGKKRKGEEAAAGKEAAAAPAAEASAKPEGGKKNEGGKKK